MSLIAFALTPGVKYIWFLYVQEEQTKLWLLNTCRGLVLANSIELSVKIPIFYKHSEQTILLDFFVLFYAIIQQWIPKIPFLNRDIMNFINTIKLPTKKRTLKRELYIKHQSLLKILNLNNHLCIYTTTLTLTPSALKRYLNDLYNRPANNQQNLCTMYLMDYFSEIQFLHEQLSWGIFFRRMLAEIFEL